MSRKRAWRLLLLLAIVALLLSSCGLETDAETGEVSTPATFDIVVKPLRSAIIFLNDSVLTPAGIASYGLSIILLTIIIRVLLYPLTRKQVESMRKMQEIQPQMKELQEKYGKDREKLAQKQMELYREAGVNPAGGCLPLLLQMPILFAFYYALIGLGPLLQERFLWIPDLSFPSYAGGMSWLQPITPTHILSASVAPYLVLPVIYLLTQIAIQRMSQVANPSSQGGASSIMMLMPVMFAYITLILPSGLSLYWVTSNIIQIVQQGMTTGWSGLLPGRRQEAAAGGVVGGLARLTGRSEEPSPSTPQPLPGPSATTAGRRRKMRKKKR